MGKWTDAAERRREIYDRQGAMLTDAQAARIVEAYPEWKSGIAITQEMIDGGRNRYRAGKQLYKTTVVHTTMESWAPELAPTVWTPIDIEHSGSYDDPIPAAVGLSYKKDLYYSEGERIFLCIRQDAEDGTTLYALPSQLLGNYFEETGL